MKYRSGEEFCRMKILKIHVRILKPLKMFHDSFEISSQMESQNSRKMLHVIEKGA